MLNFVQLRFLLYTGLCKFFYWLLGDMDIYVSQILQLGRGGMEARYGAYPLVMEKTTLLADYIENEIGVSVDYNNVSK